MAQNFLFISLTCRLLTLLSVWVWVFSVNYLVIKLNIFFIDIWFIDIYLCTDEIINFNRAIF